MRIYWEFFDFRLEEDFLDEGNAEDQHGDQWVVKRPVHEDELTMKYNTVKSFAISPPNFCLIRHN